MALSLSYKQISEQYAKSKPISQGELGAGTGTGTISGQVLINVPQLEPVSIPMTDLQFASGIKSTQRAADNHLIELGLKRVGSGSADPLENNSPIPTYLVNANRVIINSKEDYTMLFGQAGVAISSPNKVNIDSDSSITLFGMNNLYLGVPGKGTPRPDSDNPMKPQKVSNGKKLKSSPTKDFDYEPLVLGLKLTNWLDDLVQVLKNAVLLTPVGRGYFREDTQYDLLSLQARLTEMLSTYAFIDGFSHEIVDANSVPAPPSSITEAPTSITGNVTGTVEVDGATGTSETQTGDVLESLPDYATSVDLTVQYK